MKKDDKVNTTCAEGTFSFQGVDSKGRAMLKGKHGIILVPVNTVHPNGSVRFEDNGVKRKVTLI